MNTRLQQIIQYKTGGRQTSFAELMDWSPAYLNKLVKGKDFGLQPVIAIAKAFPEINTRWLLLGEGEMFASEKISQVRQKVGSSVQGLLDLDRYIRFMTDEEILTLDRSLSCGTLPNYPAERIAQWETQAAAHSSQIDSIFTTAIKKSCRRQTAK